MILALLRAQPVTVWDYMLVAPSFVECCNHCNGLGCIYSLRFGSLGFRV